MKNAYDTITACDPVYSNNWIVMLKNPTYSDYTIPKSLICIYSM